MQICGVFVAVVVAKNSLCFFANMETTVPFGRAISVRQLPFAFSPTTFFEIGVYRFNADVQSIALARITTGLNSDPMKQLSFYV